MMKTRVTHTIRWQLILVIALISLECGSAEFTAGRLYIQQEEWEKASESFRKEISIDPRNGDAWFYLGMSSKHLEQYDSAISQFRQALQIDSTLLQKVKQELDDIPEASQLTEQHDFKSKFSSAIENNNYIAADRVRIAWLDYLESFPSTSLTRTEQRDMECLRSLVGLADSTAIRLRVGIFSCLKSGMFDEAISLRAGLKVHMSSAYGTSNADFQVDYLLQHRLSEAERAELKLVHIFVEE